MSKTIMFSDVEWRSPLDVTKLGVSRVSRHPETQILMVAYAFDDRDVAQFFPAMGDKPPKEFLEALVDPEVVKTSWNKPAETCSYRNTLKLKTPDSQWCDTMVMALTASLPGKLEKAGKVLGLPEELLKHPSGSALINKFSKIHKPTKANPTGVKDWNTDPVDWDVFSLYNRRDVISERAIYRTLEPFNLPEHEWELFRLDQTINELGIPINLSMARNAMAIFEGLKENRLGRMRAITGLENPNSQQQLLGWLREQKLHGKPVYPYIDLKKGHISRALRDLERRVSDEADSEDARDVLDVLSMRADISRTSASKYKAFVDRTDDDGMFRYSVQFAGAGRTWRWAGRGAQFQNMARPTKEFEDQDVLIKTVNFIERLDAESFDLVYSKPFDALASSIRPTVQAEDGEVFADADLSAIENVVSGWISKEDKILDVFRKGRDAYLDFAQYLFGARYDDLYAEYKKGDKSKRTLAKPGVLGCQYGLGKGYEYEDEITGELAATGLLGYAWNMGVKLTGEESAKSVDVWRKTYTKVVEIWGRLEKAFVTTIRTGRPTRVNMIRFSLKSVEKTHDLPEGKHTTRVKAVCMELPSGRNLHYIDPQIKDKMTPWGQLKPQVTYMGLNDKKQWVRISTFGGKILENATQAIARDILAHGMTLAWNKGIKARIHVHDQVVAQVPEVWGEDDLATLIECLSTPPEWALDMPLRTAGFTSKFFIKD